MGHTIPYQELSLFARGIIVVNGTRKPVENPSARLKCGERQCGEYDNKLPHKINWIPARRPVRGSNDASRL